MIAIDPSSLVEEEAQALDGAALDLPGSVGTSKAAPGRSDRVDLECSLFVTPHVHYGRLLDASCGEWRRGERDPADREPPGTPVDFQRPTLDIPIGAPGWPSVPVAHCR